MITILFENRKVYGFYDTEEEAMQALMEAIDYMDGDNWCGLHAVRDYGEASESRVFELDKLEKYLKDNGYTFERIDDEKQRYDGVAGVLDLSRHQIWVTDKNGKYLWDAICHYGSYGYKEGLLEIMGEDLVGNTQSVEGWLTAEDIIHKLKAKGGQNELV